jgi:glycosyltransferase 2 family protein
MLAEPVPRLAPRALQWAGWLFGLLALLTVVTVAAHLGDIERFMELLRSLSPAWLLLALLLQAATYFSLALAWQNGLHHAGVERPVRKLLPLTLAKLFVDQAAPTGGISGTAFLVAALVRRGIAAPACLAVLLANLVGHYGANLLAALVGIGLLWMAHETQTWMVGVFALFALVSVAIPTGMLALRQYGRRAPSWLLRIPGLASLLRAAKDAPVTLLRRPRVLAVMTALSVAVILLDAGTLWVMLNALGLPTSYQVAFPSYLLAMMVTTVGPIPLGLGTFEATCVTVLVLQGLPIEGALTATLLLRGCTTWLPLLPGLILVRRELRLAQGVALPQVDLS